MRNSLLLAIRNFKSAAENVLRNSLLLDIRNFKRAAEDFFRNSLLLDIRKMGWGGTGWDVTDLATRAASITVLMGAM